MKQGEDLARQLAVLATDLVGCSEGCAGVRARAPTDGDVPRVIYLEKPETQGAGVIVVGMNPGDADDNEREVIRKHADRKNGPLARALYSEFVSNILPKHPYYTRVRGAVRALGYPGPILWTEAVKCSSVERGSLSIRTCTATFRTCGNKWLRRELDLAPPEWPVVAVGRDAFTAAALMLPGRRVLGIPHATAARSPAFWRVFGRINPKASLQVRSDVLRRFDFQAWTQGEVECLMLSVGSHEDASVE